MLTEELTSEPVVCEPLFALSFAQERLWLLDRLFPGGAVYNVAKGFRLLGELDVAALRAALDELVKRHEVLRTRFAMERRGPVQAIARELKLPLEVEDLVAEECTAREAEAQRRARQEAQVPFDLEQGPLIRARLLRLSLTEHWLLLTLHHIVTDGWSSGVLGRELSALYAACSRGEASPLPALPGQYAEYADWQRKWLQGEVLEKQLGYWIPMLANLPVLELPTDRPRPAVATFRGGRAVLEFDAELARGLTKLARHERVTLFMTLLASFQVLLSRYSGQDDIAVGVPIAGRTQPELEGLIGFFVNTLVLRGDLSGEPTFSEYLRRLRTRALEAYAHQEMPFEKLVAELAPRRDLSRNPLIQIAFTLRNMPSGELQLAGLAVEPLPDAGDESAKFDLSLAVTATADGLSVTAEYATDLFDADTIQRMLRHWHVLLEGIVADPGQAIGRLPLLTAQEREQLLVTWNATAAEYPRESCIHALFEAQVERTPQASALAMGEESLSYRELNARANQLAHHLRTLGVGPEIRVGLCVERSVAFVVGMLGILKAGGAYVPLDPEYPAKRLAFMLEDARAAVLVTHEALVSCFAAGARPTICLDRDGERIAGEPDTNPVRSTDAKNLAYVIYTSGSTGQPKGVMIEHRSLVNYVSWLSRDFPLTPMDRVLQIAPTSFDISIMELLSPLLAGARLELAPPQVHRSADDLVDLMQSRAITILQVVPSMLGAIVEGPGFARANSLRRVFTAGEVLGAELVDRFHRQSSATLINAYGPTETTVYSTVWICDRDTATRAVPIGRPIANTRAYVLDSRGQPQPVGIPGELHIGGDGVARGYWLRPELTAEKFIADGFDQAAGPRLYRTGDIARWMPDGNLEFIGRRDSQVKMRGFRIELGEVEAALARHPGIAAVAVAVREDRPGDLRLCAYFVGNDSPSPNAGELRAFLAASLPNPMIPSAYVRMPGFPLTSSGKLDRRRLPAPVTHGVDESEFVAPREGIEAQLATIFAEVLGVDRVSIHGDFFALGGHSLLAMQLLLRVKAAVGVAANPREFFRDATVAGLVRNLALAKGVVESPDAVRSDRASSGLGIRSNPRVPVVRRPKARSRK